MRCQGFDTFLHTLIIYATYFTPSIKLPQAHETSLLERSTHNLRSKFFYCSISVQVAAVLVTTRLRFGRSSTSKLSQRSVCRRISPSFGLTRRAYAWFSENAFGNKLYKSLVNCLISERACSKEGWRRLILYKIFVKTIPEVQIR